MARLLPLLLLIACGKQIGAYEVAAPAADAATAPSDQKAALKAEAAVSDEGATRDLGGGDGEPSVRKRHAKLAQELFPE